MRKIPTVTVTPQEMINILKSVTADHIRMNILHDVKMNKTNNPLITHSVTKNVIGDFQFGGSYTQRVNKAIIESATSFDKMPESFKSQGLRWGQWVEGAEGKVIAHTKNDVTKFYVRYYNAIEINDVIYSVDGHFATDEELDTIEQFLPKSKSMPDTQKNAGVAEENKVIAQVADFNHIEWILIDETRYKIAA